MSADESRAHAGLTSGRSLSHAVLEHVAAHSDDGLVVVNERQDIVFFNQAAERIFGLPRFHVLGKSLDVLLPDETASRHHAYVTAFRNWSETSRPMSRRPRVEGRRADGTTFPAEVTIVKVPHEGHRYIAALVRDVSERVRQEAMTHALLRLAAASHGEALYRDVARVAADAMGVRMGLVAELTDDGARTLSTLAMCDAGVITANQTLTVPLGSAWDDAINTGMAERAATAAGLPLPFSPESVLAVRIDDAHGLPLGLVCVGHDRATSFPDRAVDVLRVLATRAGAEVERRRSEKARAVAEAHLRNIQERAPRDWWQSADAIGATSEVDERIRHAQKVESLGRLSAGIAHDFNNLLTVIQCSVANLLEILPLAESEPRIEAQSIGSVARRGTELVRRLLAVTRPTTLQLRPVRLEHVVEDVVTLLRRVLLPSIELVVDSEVVLPTVTADPGAMEQVILNLATNALHAMPNGGRLTIRLRQATAEEASRLPASEQSPRPLALVVSDTGSGIADGVRARIFEPYFSTKPPGHGSGLGLAMVQEIVALHHGDITLESRQGRGTTFTILLPSAPPSQNPDARSPTDRDASHDQAGCHDSRASADP